MRRFVAGARFAVLDPLETVRAWFRAHPQSRVRASTLAGELELSTEQVVAAMSKLVKVGEIMGATVTAYVDGRVFHDYEGAGKITAPLALTTATLLRGVHDAAAADRASYRPALSTQLRETFEVVARTIGGITAADIAKVRGVRTGVVSSNLAHIKRMGLVRLAPGFKWVAV